MFYLQKYVTGVAKSAISALFLSPSLSSYSSAMEILQERFGSPQLVACAFRRKLESWPKISSKDHQGLQSFSDFLQQVVVATQQYPSLSILDDEFENRKLLAKLPPLISAKWVEHVVDCPSFPNFKYFSEFIKKRAKISNHSLWENDDSSSVSSARAKNLQTSANNDSRKGVDIKVNKCHICEGNHIIDKCPNFIKMSLVERKQAIMKHRLCFGCLKSGHQNVSCKNKSKCEVCSMRHPTVLHDHNRQINLSTRSPTKISHSTMVVPVCIKHGEKSHTTYALLDSQSNSHFISNDIISSLKIPFEKTSLELTTLNGKERVATRVVENLCIESLEGKGISLNRCFSKSSIPFDHSSIPTQSDIEKWPHLSILVWSLK